MIIFLKFQNVLVDIAKMCVFFLILNYMAKKWRKTSSRVYNSLEIDAIFLTNYASLGKLIAIHKVIWKFIPRLGEPLYEVSDRLKDL